MGYGTGSLTGVTLAAGTEQKAFYIRLSFKKEIIEKYFVSHKAESVSIPFSTHACCLECVKD